MIATIESMQNQGNSLDKNMNQFRCAQLTSILARAQELYDSATEVQAVLDLVDEFLTIARNLAMEVNQIIICLIYIQFAEFGVSLLDFNAVIRTCQSLRS